MADNFFGNAPNHAMPYDSVTYNGGTVPTSAGYHLVKRGSYGSVTFATNKCVVDFDAGCTFTNIRITADQCVLNFGPKTTLSADSSYGCLGIEGDRNYVYFGPQSTITDTGVANARHAENLQGHGIIISGSFNTVEGANWTVRATGPSGALAAYNSGGTAEHNTFKNMEARNVSNQGSYAVTADILMSAPHTTAYNIGSWFGAPGSVNGPPYAPASYKHGWIKIGPLAGDGSPSNEVGNGYGSRIMYCYGDLSGNNPDGSASTLASGSAGNNFFSVTNYGGEHAMMIGTYNDTGGQTGGMIMQSSYAPNCLMFGNLWDSTSNMQQGTTCTAVANIFKDPDNSNGTQTDNVAVGGSITALTND